MKITVHSFFLVSLLTVTAATAGWHDEGLKYYTSAKNSATEFFNLIDGADGARFLRSMNKDQDFNGDLSTFIDENGVESISQSTQVAVQETANNLALVKESNEIAHEADLPVFVQEFMQSLAQEDIAPSIETSENLTQVIVNTPELALPVHDGIESFVPVVQLASPVMLLEVEKSVEQNFTQVVADTLQLPQVVNAESVLAAVPVQHVTEVARNTQEVVLLPLLNNNAAANVQDMVISHAPTSSQLVEVTPFVNPLNPLVASVPESRIDLNVGAGAQNSADALEVQSNTGSLKQWFSNALDAKSQALKSWTDSVVNQTKDSFATVSTWVKENPKQAGLVGASVIGATLGGAALYKYRAQIRAKYPNLFKAAGCTALATAAVVMLQNKTGMLDSVIEKLPFSSAVATVATATAAGASTVLSMFAASEALRVPDHELIVECKTLLEMTIKSEQLREIKIEQLNELVSGYDNPAITMAFDEFMGAYNALWTHKLSVLDKDARRLLSEEQYVQCMLLSEEQLTAVITTKLAVLADTVNMHI